MNRGEVWWVKFDNKAMADQLTTVGTLRLLNRIGRIARSEMGAVEQAIRVQLALT